MKKAVAVMVTVILLTVVANCAAECRTDEALFGCWHGEDGEMLLILPDRRVIVARDGIAMCGSYTLDCGWIYLDDLHPPAWEHGARWEYAVGDSVLILWNKKEILIFNRGELHGEN